MHWLWYYFDNDNLDMPYMGMSRSIGGFYVSLWLQIALNQILPISVTEDKILLDSGQKYAIYHQNLVHLGLKNMQISHLHIKELPRAYSAQGVSKKKILYTGSEFLIKPSRPSLPEAE